MDNTALRTKCERVALVGAECEESLPLRYLNASLRDAGFEVVQIVFNRIADLESAARELAGSRAPLAGFSMVFTARAREFALLARRVRDLGYAGHIVAGGHFAAFNADSLLRDEPDLDSVAVGEGERLIVELARGLDALDSVRGLVWRHPDGRIVHNAPAGPITDLAALPRPIRLRPPDQYLGLPIANMLSSRGCTHSCNFCSIAAWHRLGGGPRFRMRPPEDVAEEMAGLYADGYRLFNFHDDNFLLGTTDRNLSRLTTLEESLARRKAGRIGLAVKSRPDSADERVFRQLKKMGLFRVFLGIEAGTEEALARLGRRQTVFQNERALEILNGLDLHVCFNLLLFNPDTTLEDFLENVEFMRKHPANPMNFCRTEVYSGTPLEARLRDEGRLEGSYWGYGYRIRDPRAQLAFELMHHTLFDRHHSEENVHHLTMRVDYERQLLGQFFNCPDDLRVRAKAFVRDVNLRSAAFLQRIGELAEAGAEPRSVSAAALRRDSDEDVRVLLQRAESLLTEIRRAALCDDRSGSVSFLRLGVAASILVAAGASSALGQHMTEMVAAPPEQPVIPQPAAAATNTVSRPGQPPDGDFSCVRSYSSRFAKILARHMDKPKEVELEVWLDKDGKTSFVAVYKPGRAKDAVAGESSKENGGKIDQLLKKLGADNFAVREKATQELVRMGFPVLSAVKSHKTFQTDPEVVQRCSQIIAAVDILADLTDYEGAIRDLKAVNLSVGSDYWGKRYVGSVTADMIQRWKSRGGGFRGGGWGGEHIFEMAPAPRD